MSIDEQTVAEDLRSRVRVLLDEHDPASSDPRDFLAARFDAGLAWVHFAKLPVAGRGRPGRRGRAAGRRTAQRHRDGDGGADHCRLRHRGAATKVLAAVVHRRALLLSVVK